MKTLVLLSFIVCTVWADIASIGFSSNGWIVDDGISISGDTLHIIGDKGSYRKARLAVSVPAETENLYLTADVKLSEIDGGPESYKTAKFKILDGTGSSTVKAFNLPDLIIDRWFSTGMVVERYNKKGLSAITVEFAIQNADGDMVVTNPRLTAELPTSEFTFPFDIPTDPTCRINIETDSVRPFPAHLLSINSHFVWADGDWGDVAVREVITDRLPLGNLRFPGGTVGNFYDWKSDGFFGDEWTFLSASRENAYNNGFRFGYDQYASLCKETGASSTLMFNVIHDDPSTAAARLTNRMASGIDIDWIELGNENFFTEQSFGNIDTPEKYISHTKAVTAALKGVDPTIRTAVNLNHHDWGEGSWNTLLANESYYDAAVIHPYVQTGTFLVNEYAAKVMLSSYKTTQHRLEEYRTYFGETPLLCTEWGVLSQGAPVNLLQVLGSADLFLALLNGNDRGTVQQMGLHMLYHSDKYNEATCYYKDNGVLKRTRLGVLYEGLVNFFTGSELYNASGFSNELESGLPGVIARAVRQRDSTKIVVVNKLPVASPLQVAVDSSFFMGNHTVRWLSGEIVDDSIGYSLDSDAWQSRDGTGEISIPPYSVAIVSLHDGVVAVNPSEVKSEGISLAATSGGIQFSLPEQADIQLLSLNGKVVDKVSSKKTGILGSSLSAGIYVIQIKTDLRQINHKLLVK